MNDTQELWTLELNTTEFVALRKLIWFNHVDVRKEQKNLRAMPDSQEKRDALQWCEEWQEQIKQLQTLCNKAVKEADHE